MSTVDTKTRHDRAIRCLTAEGFTVRQIVGALDVSRDFVRQRVKVLGIAERSAANGAERQRVVRLRKRPHDKAKRGPISAMGRAIAFPGRVDAGATALLTQILRAPRDSASLTDHAIACLHEAGLTLPDLEGAYGLPQADSVAAIRRAHHGAHP